MTSDLPSYSIVTDINDDPDRDTRTNRITHKIISREFEHRAFQDGEISLDIGFSSREKPFHTILWFDSFMLNSLHVFMANQKQIVNEIEERLVHEIHDKWRIEIPGNDIWINSKIIALGLDKRKILTLEQFKKSQNAGTYTDETFEEIASYFDKEDTESSFSLLVELSGELEDDHLRLVCYRDMKMFEYCSH